VQLLTAADATCCTWQETTSRTLQETTNLPSKPSRTHGQKSLTWNVKEER
jgi:hypothetical protein